MKSRQTDIRALLRGLALFQEMSDEELDRIAAGTVEQRAAKGQMLFRRGDPCVGFHMVVAGRVKLAFVSSQGAEKVVEIVGPGHSFGEALMFTDRPYVVFAQALVDTSLLHISRAAIDEEISREPRLARRMIAGLSARLHGLVQDVEAYALRSGMQRVIGYLLRELDDGQADAGVAGAARRVVLEVNKGVIASRLSLTPEHFSRILNELGQDGVIEVHGAEIVVLDPARMREFLV